MGEDGSYAGGISSSCIRVFLALGFEGPLLTAPLGLPFALGLMGIISGSGASGSGTSGLGSSGISGNSSGISYGVSRISSLIFFNRNI